MSGFGVGATVAITRAVSRAVAQCELTHLERQAIDVGRARAQHEAYEKALRALGCRVQQLPEEPDLADSVFVEDTAIVLDEVAVLTRPGAPSRRPEVDSVAPALAIYRELLTIQAPGTLDGGDVLRLGRHIHVGLSGRSNAAGVEQLARLLAPFGYAVVGVATSGCLHLKSAITEVAPGLALVNPAWVDPGAFRGVEILEIASGEEFAANGLRIADTLIYPDAFPRTAERLAQRGVTLRLVDLSELAKAEGAVTCCSLVFAAA